MIEIGYKKTTWYNKIVESYKRNSRKIFIIFSVIIVVVWILSQLIPSINSLLKDSGLLLSLILLVVLDISASIYSQETALPIYMEEKQDISMPILLNIVKQCNSAKEKADLLEYAGQTILPLIREIKNQGLEIRILVQHPDKLTGAQKNRSLTTLHTLYNSVFNDYTRNYQICCYKQPYTLKGRKIGNKILELGWLTPDISQASAFGHGNPSVIVDLSVKENEYLISFFNKTFDDLWNDPLTEDGRIVLENNKGLLAQ